MMSIKLGELVDQPRHVRVQALAAEQEKKKRAEEERVAKLAKARYPPPLPPPLPLTLPLTPTLPPSRSGRWRRR